MKVLVDRDDLREVLGYALQHIPDGTSMTDPQGDAWERLWALAEAPDPPTAPAPPAAALDADGIAAVLRARGFVQHSRSHAVWSFVNKPTGVTAAITLLATPGLSVSSGADAAGYRWTPPWQPVTEADVDQLLADPDARPERGAPVTLIAYEKHQTRRLSAGTAEELHAGALQLLTERDQDGWYDDLDDPIGEQDRWMARTRSAALATGNGALAWEFLQARSQGGYEYERVEKATEAS
jgi:hypothetical protein